MIDSHVHLWDPRRFRMPWLDGDPVLERRFEPPEFEQATRGLEIEGIVYVEVGATPTYGLLEAQWAARQERVMAVVASAPLEDGAVARTHLDALREIGKVHGVRRLIQHEADDFPLQLVDGLKLLPEYNLTFDICIRHEQLPATVEMVRACPDTRFVLDHLGKPPVKAGQLEPWRSRISQLAALPNVVCKVSGVVTEADHAAWTVADLRPFVEHVLTAFGPDRAMFGSDWPVVTHAASYARWVETLRELVPATDNKVWSETARRVYAL